MSKSIDDWSKMKYGRVINEEELKKRTHPAWPYLYFNPGKPVDPEKVNDILKGAIDLHIHGAPLGSWLAGRPTMVETCLEASEAGMKALVFKDHNTMNNNCAIIVQDFLSRMQKEKAQRGEVFTPVEVFGGITLNYTVGGMNPKAVEVALGYGRCKEVWLPSLDAKHQQEAMGRQGGMYMLEGGDLIPELKKILGIMAEFNKNSQGERVILSGCHVSNEEKVAILDYINKMGMDIDMLMDHVTQELTMVTPQEAKEMIDKGAYLEFAECSCVPWPGMQDWIIAFDYSFNLIKELIKEKGPDHIVLTTDAGQPNNKPIPGWKVFINTLLAQGVTEKDINTMAKDVPTKLLGKI